MLTPFCCVCHQFFNFTPDSAHILQILSDIVHPVFLWPSQLPLVSPQFTLYSLTRYSGVLHSQISTRPSHLSLISLMMSSSFHNPFFFVISSLLTLIFHVIPKSFCWNLRVYFILFSFSSVSFIQYVTRWCKLCRNSQVVADADQRTNVSTLYKSEFFSFCRVSVFFCSQWDMNTVSA